MEWFVVSAPAPAAVEFPIVLVGLVAAGLVAAVIPVVLAARAAWQARTAAPKVPELRVLDGRRELSRRAA